MTSHTRELGTPPRKPLNEDTSRLRRAVGSVLAAAAAAAVAAAPAHAAPSADCVNRLPCFQSWVTGRTATNSFLDERLLLLRQPIDRNPADTCPLVLKDIAAKGNPPPDDMSGFMVGCTEMVSEFGTIEGS